jgi:hypothetical protein
MAKQKPNDKIDPNKYLKNKDIDPESRLGVSGNGTHGLDASGYYGYCHGVLQ